jgi:hypothetical protein
MKKQWNKDIRDQLKDFPKKAPEGLLDDIKAEMLRRGLSSALVGQPRQTRLSVLFRVASVAAVALLLFGISYLWQEQFVLPTIPEQADSFINSFNSSVITETEVPESQPLVPNSSSLIAKATKKVSSDSDIPSHKEEIILQEVANEELQEKEEGKEDEQPKENKLKKAEKEYVETSSKPKWTYDASSRKKSSISFGVYYSGIIAQVDPTIKDYDADISSGPNYNPDPSPNDSTEVAWSRRATTTYHLTGKATHHLPIKLGVSFRYDLDERWNLQSGLTYSYLASDISEKIGKNSYDTKQKLHYMGIPLQIGYKLRESKRFRSYIAAGFQVEKLVSGKAITRHSKNKELQGTSIQNISDKRLLFSTLASFGVEYALGNNFSLYAEPGIHYYFKNGNGLQTHYNEQPLDLNLTIGFRFHRK